MSRYETVIGLEVHAELLTRSKLFCGCATEFGAEPNTHCCPVCLGLPGVLPVLNQRALDYAILAALALNAEIAGFSKFDRKNYFYPDLPKAYQISQYDLPLATGGWVEIKADGAPKRIGLTRVHLEEEAGKSVHSGESIIGSEYSLEDYNRVGIPLIEIVSEPDLRSPAEAHQYLERLKAILQYAGVSDCKMEEGSLRCDANISLRPAGQAEFGVKVEIKNLNSFRAVLRALEYEVVRQTALLDSGTPLVQETRAWDEGRGVTVSMRSKEEAHDYRYFPEPDLPPVVIDREWVKRLGATLPEFPGPRAQRFVREFGLPEYDADLITSSRRLADWFEEAVQGYHDPKAVANWVMGDLLRLLRAEGRDLDELSLTPGHLVEMLRLLEQGTISGRIAKTVFEEMFLTGRRAGEIVQAKGLVQISDEGELVRVVETVLAANPKSVADFRGGKEAALGFLVGQVMKETKGRANPGLVNQLLRSRLVGDQG
jgi:aspartyl-tRNA(Asn)/glutamyl-tRNA(Gln) amidotransferase subunit B